MSSQSRELETSSIADRDATTTTPPVGGGSQTGAQESPSTSDVELEYDVVPPDKGKGKAVPDNTAQGGSGHDPPRERERMSRLSRRNESDDCLQSRSTRRRPTRRSDNEDTGDGLASEVKKVAESSAKAQRKTQASLSSLDQCISALKKKYQGRAETSRSRDGRLQTRHTRNDELGLNPQRDSRPTREGREQDGPPHHPSNEQDGPLRHPSNEPDDRPERLSPQHSQRNLDEETPVDAVTRS